MLDQDDAQAFTRRKVVDDVEDSVRGTKQLDETQAALQARIAPNIIVGKDGETLVTLPGQRRSNPEDEDALASLWAPVFVSEPAAKRRAVAVTTGSSSSTSTRNKVSADKSQKKVSVLHTSIEAVMKGKHLIAEVVRAETLDALPAATKIEAVAKLVESKLGPKFLALYMADYKDGKGTTASGDQNGMTILESLQSLQRSLGYYRTLVSALNPKSGKGAAEVDIKSPSEVRRLGDGSKSSGDSNPGGQDPRGRRSTGELGT